MAFFLVNSQKLYSIQGLMVLILLGCKIVENNGHPLILIIFAAAHVNKRIPVATIHKL